MSSSGEVNDGKHLMKSSTSNVEGIGIPSMCEGVNLNRSALHARAHTHERTVPLDYVVELVLRDSSQVEAD